MWVPGLGQSATQEVLSFSHFGNMSGTDPKVPLAAFRIHSDQETSTLNSDSPLFFSDLKNPKIDPPRGPNSRGWRWGRSSQAADLRGLLGLEARRLDVLGRAVASPGAGEKSGAKRTSKF